MRLHLLVPVLFVACPAKTATDDTEVMAERTKERFMKGVESPQYDGESLRDRDVPYMPEEIKGVETDCKGISVPDMFASCKGKEGFSSDSWYFDWECKACKKLYVTMCKEFLDKVIENFPLGADGILRTNQFMSGNHCLDECEQHMDSKKMAKAGKKRGKFRGKGGGKGGGKNGARGGAKTGKKMGGGGEEI